MGHHQPIRGIPHRSGGTASEIPDKLYFRIGEVARLCEIPAYVLRFWESEFPQLKPNKGGTGQRLYRRRDVELALRVKTLLKDEGYTIPGARQVLKSEFKQKGPQLALIETAAASSDLKPLRALRRELEAIAAMLSQPVAKLASAKQTLLSHSAGDEPEVQTIRPSRRTGSRAQNGPAAVAPLRAADRIQPGELLFDLHPTASNDEGDGR
jgi:DNA-binding transcriptional MerR regulator